MTQGSARPGQARPLLGSHNAPLLFLASRREYSVRLLFLLITARRTRTLFAVQSVGQVCSASGACASSSVAAPGGDDAFRRSVDTNV